MRFKESEECRICVKIEIHISDTCRHSFSILYDLQMETADAFRGAYEGREGPSDNSKENGWSKQSSKVEISLAKLPTLKAPGCGGSSAALVLLWVGTKQSCTFSRYKACILKAPCCGGNPTARGVLWVGMKQGFTSSVYKPLLSRAWRESLTSYMTSSDTFWDASVCHRGPQDNDSQSFLRELEE